MSLYNTSQLFGFEVANMVSSGLSLIGASAMGIFYIIVQSLTIISSLATSIIYIRPWLQNSRADEKILFSMCLVSIIGSLAMVQNQQVLKDQTLCQIQATLLQYAVLSLPIFNLCQSFNFWYILTEGKTPGKFSWIYLTCGFLVPLIASLYGVVTGVFGNALIWCWIKKSSMDMRYALFYAPLWLCIVVGIIFTFLGVRKVYAIEKQGNISNYKHTRTASKAFLYGLVFVIVWVPGTVRF